MKAHPTRLAKRELRAMLAGPDRRSIGQANRVANALVFGRCAIRHAVALLSDDDPLVRMRAADALEKASAQDASLIEPFGWQLIELLCQAEQQELRWHLAQMVPRLPLGQLERRTVVSALRRYLEDRSSIVKTCALEALARVAAGNPRLESDVNQLLRDAERYGTSAMRARARRLLHAEGAAL